MNELPPAKPPAAALSPRCPVEAPEDPRSPSPARRLRRLMAALVVTALAFVLLACGGAGEPSVRLLLEADLSQLSADADPGQAMNDVAQVLERRAEAFTIPDVNIEPQGENRLSVTVRGLPSQDAQQLFGATARLEIRQPLLDEDGRIVCQTADGSRFSVPPEEISYTTFDPRTRPLPRCSGSGEQDGDLLWEPASADDGSGRNQVLTGAFIPGNGAVVDRTRAPVLVVSFTQAGGQLLQAITSQLVGLPVGVFLDDRLLAGPTVLQPIVTGNMAISGLSLHEAGLVAAQLNAGPLPAPISVVDAPDTP